MIDIPALIDRQLLKEQEEQGPYRSAHNNASSIGRACLRELYYRRTAPEFATPHTADTLRRFEKGKMTEAYYKSLMARAGIEVLEGQRYSLDTDDDTSGRIDGRVRDDDQSLPIFEVKAISTHVFKRLNKATDFVTDYDLLLSAKTADDFERFFSRQPYYFANLAQLVSYLKAHREPVGLLLVIDTDTLEDKQIVVFFSEWEELAVALSERADRLNEHLKNSTLPNKINRPGYCDKFCQFCAGCGPELAYGINYTVVTDPDVVRDCETVELAKEIVNESNRAKKRIAGTFDLEDKSEHTWIVTEPGGGQVSITKKRQSNGSVRTTTERNS